MNKKLVEIKNNALKSVGIPISSSTIKGWWHKGQYLDLRIKIGGRVFLDVDKFYKKFNLPTSQEA